VSIGVPQGFIFGPLLFALCINDLPTVVKYSMLDLYADDAEMHCSHSDLSVVESYLQSDLDAVTHWQFSALFKKNIVKSNSMLIGSHQRIANKTLDVSIRSTILAQINYLRVTIDPTLSWNLHVSNVVSRAQNRIASIL